ncbi:conserved hypothetical protein [Gammaproteobacteria bacterium]
MGRFANATEDEAYWEKYCDRCMNSLLCPVWELHLYHDSDRSWTEVLNCLIPRSGTVNKKCKLFKSRERKT